MMRNPRACRPSGTEPPALFGSRDAPTTAIVVERSRTSFAVRPNLRSADAGLGGALERVLEHLFHPAGQVEGHRLAHALGHVVEVLLVAAGKDDLCQPHA